MAALPVRTIRAAFHGTPLAEGVRLARRPALLAGESYAENEDASGPLRAFSRKTLPVLKEHDRQIEQPGQGQIAGP